MAQSVEASDSKSEGYGFESHLSYMRSSCTFGQGKVRLSYASHNSMFECWLPSYDGSVHLYKYGELDDNEIINRVEYSDAKWKIITEEPNDIHYPHIVDYNIEVEVIRP